MKSIETTGSRISVKECDDSRLTEHAVLIYMIKRVIDPGTTLDMYSGVEGQRWQEAPESSIGGGATSYVSPTIADIIMPHSGARRQSIPPMRRRVGTPQWGIFQPRMR